MKPAKIALLALVALIVLMFLRGNVSGFSLRGGEFESKRKCQCGKDMAGNCKLCNGMSI